MSSAAGWSGTYCVTAYVGGIKFERPVAIGDLVEVRARVLLTGNSSMHVGVEVSARDPRSDTPRRTTNCMMVFVAMDDARKPVAVPPFVPQTEGERELAAFAQRIIDLRAAVEAERERFLTRHPG